MQITKAMALQLLMVWVAPSAVLAQAIGEYGRIVGGIGPTQNQMIPKNLGSPQNTNGQGFVEGVGDIGGRSMPSSVVVASRQAALYPRQDDESEKIAELFQGDTLVPIGQTNDWYMVKTQKGLIGWIKSADVRSTSGKN